MRLASKVVILLAMTLVVAGLAFVGVHRQFGAASSLLDKERRHLEILERLALLESRFRDLSLDEWQNPRHLSAKDGIAGDIRWLNEPAQDPDLFNLGQSLRPLFASYLQHLQSLEKMADEVDSSARVEREQILHLSVNSLIDSALNLISNAKLGRLEGQDLTLSEIQSQLDRLHSLAMALLLLCLVLIMGSVWFFRFVVALPLQRMRRFVAGLGVLDTSLVGRLSGNEIDTYRESLAAYCEVLKEQCKKLLALSIRGRKAASMGSDMLGETDYKDRVLVERLREICHQVGTSNRKMVDSLQQVSDSTADVGKTMEAITGSLSVVDSCLGELDAKSPHTHTRVDSQGEDDSMIEQFRLGEQFAEELQLLSLNATIEASANGEGYQVGLLHEIRNLTLKSQSVLAGLRSRYLQSDRQGVGDPAAGVQLEGLHEIFENLSERFDFLLTTLSTLRDVYQGVRVELKQAEGLGDNLQEILAQLRSSAAEREKDREVLVRQLQELDLTQRELSEVLGGVQLLAEFTKPDSSGKDLATSS